ncbi:discoidin domain-containing protein [Lysinibacillus fusiformis]|uniref:discoidin domain-containing protein n=1 Tax=Lysinibacillus fusiformis TaxID=28031 RepID=UPI0018E6243A|nr:discoidin domain-containing protein [Lysinibacillus fusiformis]MBI6863901.1 discoidin domain-containing protein [Lysinibacillus fusiformis]
MVEVKKTPHPYNITMTSNTSPAPYTVTASSEVASQPAWKAFANSWWYATSSVPQWINMDFGLLREIGYIRFTNSGNATSIPTSYTLSGSKDGITFTELVTEKYAWDSVNRAHKIDFPQNFYKAIKLTINSVSGTGSAIVGAISFGYYTYSSYMAIRNENSYYSLSDNTLIHLPDNTTESIIEHGIEQGKFIQLDVPFDKHRYFNNTPVDGTSGKVFTHDVRIINTLSIKEFAKNEIFEPIFTWYETKMNSDALPSPLKATASSYYVSNVPYTYFPFRAFDGNISDISTSNTSCWATDRDAFVDSWLMLDFGELRKVNTVQLTPRNETWITQAAKEFKIESSIDGAVWNVVGNFDITDWQPLTSKKLDLSLSEGRYFRITHKSNNGGQYISWTEVKYGYKREVN